MLERLVGLGGVTTDKRTPQGSPYHGVASVGGFQARTVPSENNDEGYISWHRDKPPADHWPLPNYRVIKVLMNFWDVAADGGATAVVPASVSVFSYSQSFG